MLTCTSAASPITIGTTYTPPVLCGGAVAPTVESAADLSCWYGLVMSGASPMQYAMLQTPAQAPGARACIAFTQQCPSSASLSGPPGCAPGLSYRYYMGVPSLQHISYYAAAVGITNVLGCTTAGCNSPFTDSCGQARVGGAAGWGSRYCGIASTTQPPTPVPAAADISCAPMKQCCALSHF